jgi:hypothetical protein
MNRCKYLLGIGALVMIFSSLAAADTLELKDGRVLHGKFLGGTQVIVRFEVDGDVQSFRATKIVSLTFDRNSRRADADRDDRRDDRQYPDQQQPSNQQYPPDQQYPDQQPPPPQNGPDAGAYPQGDDRRDDRRDDSRRDDGDYDRGGDRRDRDFDSRRIDDDREGRRAVYAAPGTAITIPTGKLMLVRMIDEVDSRHNSVGDGFHASLETDLTVNGVLVALRGTDIYGKLDYVKEAGHLAGSAELQLELTSVIIDGKEYPIVSGDYTVRGKGRGGDTAKKVGTGAVVGAVIGGIAGGGTGAAIGAGVGSAAGAGVQLATKGKEVRVPSETLLEFRLDQPVTVTAVRK